MTPGGSMANFYSIQLATHAKFPEAKVKGIYGLRPMKIFTSDVSHYSFTKGAFFLGIGV
jgi:glutamate/tyrosine decarboxylase-like PLP-dependent enzyme